LRGKVTNGWFFRAESFFSLARYFDDAAREPLSGPPPDFLSHSHGEVFCASSKSAASVRASTSSTNRNRAVAVAPNGVSEVDAADGNSGHCQIIMATHSPMLMAYPDARLLQFSKYGLEPVTVRETDHYKVMREFCEDPVRFVEAVVRSERPVGLLERSETHRLRR
jgi:predicted ATPase